MEVVPARCKSVIVNAPSYVPLTCDAAVVAELPETVGVTQPCFGFWTDRPFAACWMLQSTCL